MSLADLRKELKNLRKEAMPTPVSRMQKTAVAMELERLRGRSVAKVEVPVVAEKVVVEKPKVVAEKKEKKEKVAEKPKAEKPKKEEAPKEEKYVPSKFVKGSQEAKDRMAEIRSKKGTKKSE